MYYKTIFVQALCMLCHSQHLLSSTVLLLGITCLFRTKPETPPPNCVETDPPKPQWAQPCCGCSGHRRGCTSAMCGAAAPATLCEPELWCEPELLHFLPLCCFVLLHCWLARPPSSPRQRMHPEFSVFLFSESLPYFLLFRL